MDERREVEAEIKILRAVKPRPRTAEWLKDYKVMRDNARSCDKINGG